MTAASSVRNAIESGYRVVLVSGEISSARSVLGEGVSKLRKRWLFVHGNRSTTGVRGV